jgi:transcription termination factor NusB
MDRMLKVTKGRIEKRQQRLKEKIASKKVCRMTLVGEELDQVPHSELHLVVCNLVKRNPLVLHNIDMSCMPTMRKALEAIEEKQEKIDANIKKLKTTYNDLEEMKSYANAFSQW